MTIGEKIQDLRRRSGMSQDTLAEKLEVSRQAVSKWERDEALPEMDNIVKLCQLFDVSTDYLLLDQPTVPIPPRNRKNPWGQRLERMLRKHGYKAGYALIAWGAVLCLIGLLAILFLPAAAEGFLKGNQIQDPFGYGMGYMDYMYLQQVAQIQSTWLGGVRIISMVFGVPVMVFGITLIVSGIVAIRKGKKLSQNTQ